MILTQPQVLEALGAPDWTSNVNTVAVRFPTGEVHRIINVYYDEGDGYYVIEVESDPVSPDDES